MDSEFSPFEKERIGEATTVTEEALQGIVTQLSAIATSFGEIATAFSPAVLDSVEEDNGFQQMVDSALKENDGALKNLISSCVKEVMEEL